MGYSGDFEGDLYFKGGLGGGFTCLFYSPFYALSKVWQE